MNFFFMVAIWVIYAQLLFWQARAHNSFSYVVDMVIWLIIIICICVNICFVNFKMASSFDISRPFSLQKKF